MLIIGITGGSGSGKTTIVEEIQKYYDNEVSVISQDAYYRDNSKISLEDRGEINFDHPDSIEFELILEHVQQLRQGKQIGCPVYSFKEHTRTVKKNVIFSREILVVEGILLFTNQNLLDLFDLKVYIHADSDIRLARIIKRDILERGRDVDEVLGRYLQRVKPMFNKFVEPAKAISDIIINNNNVLNVSNLLNEINRLKQYDR